MIAFASACTAETQCPSSITHPTSSQCGRPRIDPLYPVERIVRSRAITAPTCFLGHVARVATCRAMFMKYVCQSTRSGMAALCPRVVVLRLPLYVSESRLMNKERRVVVTGICAVTSIGGNVPEFWKNLLEGRCGIGGVTLFDASTSRTQTAAEVREIP